MPDAPPVTSAVFRLRSLMRNPRRWKARPHGPADAASTTHLLAHVLHGEPVPTSPGQALAVCFAEQHAAFHLVLLFRLDERHHDGGGLDLVILHHRVGDVLHQRALLVERASAEGIDNDFRHISSPWIPMAARSTARQEPLFKGALVLIRPLLGWRCRTWLWVSV